MKTGLRVFDAMTGKPIVVSPDETMEKCARKMLKNDIGSVVVAENKKLIGIITEKDLVEKVVARSLNSKKEKARKIMTKLVHTTTPDIDLYDALLYMLKNHIRRLPVVNDGKLIGIITHRDILKLQPDLYMVRKEYLRIKEAGRKLKFVTNNKDIEGECESCGNFTLVHGVNGKILCDECKLK